MVENYKQIIERIAKESNLSIEDIERRIEAKRAKLSGLISLEGAAQVIAAELKVNIEKSWYKISELNIGMRKTNVIGKIIQIYPIRTYKKNERENEIGSFMIADDTGNIRVVLWDTNHIQKIKNAEIKENEVIEIKNADVRGTMNKELHLNSFSQINNSEEKIENVVLTEKRTNDLITKISELKQDAYANIRGTIVQIFQPSFFKVCPTCNMKVTFENEKAICPKHELVVPKEKAILNLVLDDGTDNIRAIVFTEAIADLYGTSGDVEILKDSSFNESKKADTIGKEFIVNGKARHNVLFDRDEFVISRIREANPEDLIKELLKDTENNTK